MTRTMKFARAATMLGALISMIAPAAARAQSTDSSFHWSGAVPSGRWISIENVNGSVYVERGSGPNVEVTATRRWRHSDPQSVHFAVEHYGSGNQDVRVCALWGDRSSCSDHDDSHSMRNNDVSVEFRVKVPDGVKVNGETVNGGVSISGVTAEVDAQTVNGSVEVNTTGGPVNAETVNGSVRASMGKFALNDDLTFSSVNGSVIVDFAGDVDMNVDLSTVNGRFNTDYPVTVSGRLDPKNLRAKIGKGGPTVKLSTVNGNVEIRRHD